MEDFDRTADEPVRGAADLVTAATRNAPSTGAAGPDGTTGALGLPLYDIPVERINGSATTLREHCGKVLLVVNVASRCGLTPQYAGLEGLHEQYARRGFAVLGFPANDFAAQEPGENGEIEAFCRNQYGVQFPLYAKIAITGPDKHPFYRCLVEAFPEVAGRERMEGMLRGHGIEPTQIPDPVWNFEKFLVDRGGKVIGRFAPDTEPGAAELVQAIETALDPE